MVNQRYLDIFEKLGPKSKIIVVGACGKLSDYQMGEIIDQYDIVARINFPQIIPHISGSRTDVRVINPKAWIHRVVIEERQLDITPVDMLIINSRNKELDLNRIYEMQPYKKVVIVPWIQLPSQLSGYIGLRAIAETFQCKVDVCGFYIDPKDFKPYYWDETMVNNSMDIDKQQETRNMISKYVKIDYDRIFKDIKYIN